MRSADDYRELARKARADIDKVHTADLRAALERLAVHYEKLADSIDGMKRPEPGQD